MDAPSDVFIGSTELRPVEREKENNAPPLVEGTLYG
jgi:hypothetical protein